MMYEERMAQVMASTAVVTFFVNIIFITLCVMLFLLIPYAIIRCIMLRKYDSSIINQICEDVRKNTDDYSKKSIIKFSDATTPHEIRKMLRKACKYPSQILSVIYTVIFAPIIIVLVMFISETFGDGYFLSFFILLAILAIAPLLGMGVFFRVVQLELRIKKELNTGIEQIMMCKAKN